MKTVPEAARLTGRNPETVRRWIREGRLPARKVGTQHLIEDADLARLTEPSAISTPAWWLETATGEAMPDWVAIVRSQRAEH